MVRLRNTIQLPFHFGASAKMIKRARELRKIMTPAEHYLWKYLRNRRFHGVKFRRQHPIKIFIVDFYCHQAGLVIELDGEIHQDAYQAERDFYRTLQLKKLGLEVIRFRNQEVLSDVDSVLEVIEKKVR